jgi:hypothetical protein
MCTSPSRHKGTSAASGGRSSTRANLDGRDRPGVLLLKVNTGQASLPCAICTVLLLKVNMIFFLPTYLSRMLQKKHTGQATW